MGKLLHERMRSWANKADARDEYALTLAIEDMDLHNGKYREAESKLLHAFADEIERTYAALPRFEDGKPVGKGCEVEGGIVDGWCVWDDGAFTLNDEEGNILQKADPGEFVKRPTPKVCDADGVEINEEETCYGTGREQHCYTVQKVPDINEEVGERFCVRCYDHNEGNIVWVDPAMLTHREPDSLEKLCDDIGNTNLGEFFDGGAEIAKSWHDRLTALIERGAR